MSEWRGLLLPHDALRARVLYHLIMPLVALYQKMVEKTATLFFIRRLLQSGAEKK